MLHQALCITSNPLVNSNCSYSRETPNLGQNRQFFLAMWPCNLTIDLKKTIEHLFHVTSSFVHHLVAIGEFKLVLQSGNARIWLKFDNF